MDEDGRRRDGPRGAEGRRPADVFVPCWRSGRPAALDFAVSSGLRVGALTLSAEDGSSNVESYAAWKRAYLHTAEHCNETGIEFVPMVVEASGGGWGADARSALRDLSRAASQLTGDSAACKAEQFAQSLSITLHRANARAILRRAPMQPSAPPALAAAHAALAGAAADAAAAAPSRPASPSRTSASAASGTPAPAAAAPLGAPHTAAAAAAVAGQAAGSSSSGP